MEETIEELKEQTGKEGTFLNLDLSDLNSVKEAAKEFQRSAFLYLLISSMVAHQTNSKEKDLHVLFNNAYDVLNIQL